MSFRTSLPFTLSTTDEDCDPFERRRVVRALTRVRQRLEDQLRFEECPPRGPAADLLVEVCRELKLTTLEFVATLGPEICEELAWFSVIPDTDDRAVELAWEAAHPDGAELPPIDLRELR